MPSSFFLPGKPCDIALVNDTTAIITLPGRKQVQYIEVVPRLKLGRVLQLDTMAWGIDVEIYVTCHKGGFVGGDGEVWVVDRDGNLRKRLGMNPNGTFMFTLPVALAVSSKSNRIYVSDGLLDTLACPRSDGRVIYQYKDPEMSYPEGLCVDDEENITVCGRDSHNVHVVTAEGEKHCILLSTRDGIKYPYSVAYRYEDDTMIVGCYENDNMFMVRHR